MPSGQGTNGPFSNIDSSTLYGHLINGNFFYFYCKTAAFNALPCFLIEKVTDYQSAFRNKNCMW